MKESKNSNVINRTDDYPPYSEKNLLQELVRKGLLTREKITDDEYNHLKNDDTVFLYVSPEGTKYRITNNETTKLNILSKIYSDISFFKILAIVSIICSVLSPIIANIS